MYFGSTPKPPIVECPGCRGLTALLNLTWTHPAMSEAPGLMQVSMFASLCLEVCTRPPSEGRHLEWFWCTTVGSNVVANAPGYKLLGQPICR